MVLPTGVVGGLGVVPPAELTKFKPALIFVGVGYLVTIVVGLVGGIFSNALSYVCVVVIALFMAFRPRDCLGQCVVPLTLFSGILLLFDTLNLGLLIVQDSFSFGTFFSTYCPTDETSYLGTDGAGNTIPIIVNATTYYLQPNDPITGERIYVDVERQRCSWQTVLQKCSLIGGVILDCLSLLLGSQMWKAWQLFAEGGAGLVANEAPPGGGPAGGPRGADARQRFTPFQGQPQALNG